MATDFWRDRRVLVTGHTGFKGGWLCLWLNSMGARVTGFALAPATSPSLFEVARVGEGMRSVLGDVRDLPALRKVMLEAAPEIVMHLAAQPLVRASYEDPVGTYATNILGTVHVIEAARWVPSVKAIVIVTSDKCYEDRESPWSHREIDPLGGFDPYSSSKGCAELVSAAYRRSYGLPLATVRAGNVIGGGDWSQDRLVPDILRALEASRPVEIRNPGAIRPWQHVLEPLRGYLAVAERLFGKPADFAEGWNFGPADADCQPVSRVVEDLVAEWGKEATWKAQPGGHPHEAGFLRLDSSKARARLGWRSKLDLGRSLALTATWHRAWRAGEDMASFTLQQIKEHG